ncbi:pyridoxamine 5'-phosphate oxidase family protein [Streptomyces silvisoli]|uniref:Pyridoxamine 5'-phosphate oxidase family protein n=1 Tax=Streptomyces silvisoli TaxID=3034235 RepID=A0ABT5ZJ39_9ACTN|nr:pyridoxamine 5'-phosphate oxidase family protein [Streptomyces silvisoli]MDF3289584.1 pyridoxamine 5'-phosphate oxidase family protein [Streptomyces silvisoli]
MTQERPSPSRMVELSEAEALELLAGVSLGRVVFSQQALPAIRPVSHIVDDGQVVFLVHDGAAILSPTAERGVVAYEADELDPSRHTGWSVIVTGTAHLVSDSAEVSRYRTKLTPWTETGTAHVIRISPEIITGYRLEADAG